jgi:hypothetical protein
MGFSEIRRSKSLLFLFFRDTSTLSSCKEEVKNEKVWFLALIDKPVRMSCRGKTGDIMV